MRKTMAAAAALAVSLSALAGGVAAAAPGDVTAAGVYGPFKYKDECLAYQGVLAGLKHEITAPCHRSGGLWYFKAR